MSNGMNPGAMGLPGKIADYRPTRYIGRSRLATVYLAHDERMGRTVALKVLVSSVTGQGAFRTRFLRESEAAATVGHPNIVPIYEVGDTGQNLFIAMQYVQGGDAGSLLRTAGPLPPAGTWNIVAQVASALDAAHARGLVHGDVKPSNMLLDSGGGPGAAAPGAGQVYLSDFGIGLSLPPDAPPPTGQELGAPSYDYTAPEQAAGHPADGRADVYSLACAAYELLCAAPPFGRDQGMTARYAHMYARPPTATALRPDLPSDVDIVLATAMAKDPAGRYSRCGEFADALRTALRLATGSAQSSLPLLVGPDGMNRPPGPDGARAAGAQPAPGANGARPAPDHFVSPSPHLPAQPQAAAAGGPYRPYPGADGPFPGDDERYPGPGQTYRAPGGVYIGPPGPPSAPTQPTPTQQFPAPGSPPGGAPTEQYPAPGRSAGGDQAAETVQWPHEQRQPPNSGPEGVFLEHAGWYRQPGQSSQGQEGWHGERGGRYAGGPGSAPGHRPPREGKRLVLAATAVTLAIAVILVGVLLSRGPGGHPASAVQPSPSASSSPAPRSASGQATVINNLLSSSANARQSLPGAVTGVLKCRNVHIAISQMQGVVNQRNSEVSQASALSVSALANGATVKSDLVAALRSSLMADQDYLSWAQQESSACQPGARTGGYQAALSADSQAAAAKHVFIGVWNQVARTYGLPQQSASSF